MTLRRAFVSLVCAAAILAACAEPQVAVKRQYDFSKVKRVAVLDFAGPGGEAAADHLIQALLQRGADVVERRALEALLKETRLGATGAFEARTARDLGKVLGVDAVFTGSVTEYSPARSYIVFEDESRHPRPPAALGSGTVVSRGPAAGIPGSDILTSAAVVGLSARMVDVETGSILWSANLTWEGIDLAAAMTHVARSFVRSLDEIWLKRLG